MENGMMFITVAFAFYHMWCIRVEANKRKEIREESERLIGVYRKLIDKQTETLVTYRKATESMAAKLEDVKRIHLN